jgi:hypothetical protein
VAVCDGTVADIDYDEDVTSWTVGANYSFTDFMSAYGRVIGWITSTENFRFQVVANYLDGEYTDFDACAPFSNVVTGDGCARIEGQQLQRQPKLRYMLTPSCLLPLPWGDIQAHVTYTHVGDHTQDQSGLQQLGEYYTWDFGITASVGENWLFALRGTNVTDELGLTESNSRIFGVAAGTGGVLLARRLKVARLTSRRSTSGEWQSEERRG